MPALLTVSLPPSLSSLIVCLAVLLGAASCTRPNPDFCCVSAADCAAQGLDELRTCGGDKVCASNACIVAQCAGDSDCIGAPGGEVCADDHVCVGCESNADCDEGAPICDLAKRACAPCRTDGECTSGICLAADGVCAKGGELLYVSSGGTDINSCNIKEAPCRTFPYALQFVTSVRRVIRLLGRSYSTTDGIIIDSKEVYIDAENTELTRGTTGPIVSFTGSGKATIEGIKLTANGSDGVAVFRNDVVRVSQVDMTSVQASNVVYVATGTAHISNSTFTNAWILCNQATLLLETSKVLNGAVDGGTDCVGTIRRSTFNDARVTITGGLTFENNLVIVTSPTCYNNFSGGSVNKINFNTWVCRHTPPVDNAFEGVAFSCAADDRPTGNLLAWDSLRPVGNCTLRYNLLPSFADPNPGTDNIHTDISRVFVDYLGGDYHLSASSPAKGAADPKSTLTIDLEGKPRPNPQGSAPDIGAFEAP